MNSKSLIADLIKEKEITEALHFTTNKGMLGILSTASVKSRKRLPKSKQLEYVYSPNCVVRRDLAWLDYVNLSISRINSKLFDIASRKWHRDSDVWWCIASFDSQVLTHPGVFFCTTNNMYTGVIRGQGDAGLKRLFSDSVIQYEKSIVRRNSTCLAKWPTCMQAEALYPGELSTEYLLRVYVATDEHSDIISAQCYALSLPEVTCLVRPEMFT